MKTLWIQNSVNKYFTSLVIIMILSVFVFGLSNANGVELYSKNDKPFGIPYEDWITKWWNWWIKVSKEEAIPKENGCLMNKSDSMVMLMETAVASNHQNCKISSKDGIMIPIWTGWVDASNPDHKNAPYEELKKAVRQDANSGAVTSLVKVDGIPVAKLDEVSKTATDGTLDYKINSINNVTEIASKEFNITIPKETHFPDNPPGTFRAAAQGWYVFVKPLPPGNHTIDYNVNVGGEGINPTSSEIKYSFQVD
jgi:hypothetical protein